MDKLVWKGWILTHNVCRMFSEGFHKVKAVPTFWKHSGQVFHNVSWCDHNLHVQHCSTQNKKTTWNISNKGWSAWSGDDGQNNLRSNGMLRFLGGYGEMIHTQVQRTLRKLSILTFNIRSWPFKKVLYWARPTGKTGLSARVSLCSMSWYINPYIWRYT